MQTESFKVPQLKLRDIKSFEDLFANMPPEGMSGVECGVLDHQGQEGAVFIILGPDTSLLAGHIANFVNELFNAASSGLELGDSDDE
jgi:hypothetical protein